MNVKPGFSRPNTLPEMMTERGKQPQFGAIWGSDQTPEEIKERHGQNPAAQIELIFPSYRKVLHGPTATAQNRAPEDS